MDKLNFLKTEFPKLLRNLNPEAKGEWGVLNGQQMVEHMAESISYATGKNRRDSDIDILVEPPKGIGFGFAGIQMELEEKLKRKVHLVTYKYIHPYIKKTHLLTVHF